MSRRVGKQKFHSSPAIIGRIPAAARLTLTYSYGTIPQTTQTHAEEPQPMATAVTACIIAACVTIVGIAALVLDE